MGTEHIVKSFDAELERINGEITRMGEMALGQIQAAVDVLQRRDSKAAERVTINDDAIDELEQVISNDVLRVLALRQPMARDLREVYAALRIAADIERIGDYASNVAKRSMVLNQSAPVAPARPRWPDWPASCWPKPSRPTACATPTVPPRCATAMPNSMPPTPACSASC